jgi:hypothetical protein
MQNSARGNDNKILVISSMNTVPGELSFFNLEGIQ